MNSTNDARAADLISSLSLIPYNVWVLYVKYLWFYQPESYVAKVANTFRILAVVIAIPIVILGLLVRIMFRGLRLFLTSSTT